MPIFVPLTLESIEDEAGTAHERINSDLAELQEYLIQFVKKHGLKAKGATAKLKAELIIKCENPELQSYSVSYKSEDSLPKRPSVVSLGVGATDQTDRLCLQIQKYEPNMTLPLFSEEDDDE